MLNDVREMGGSSWQSFPHHGNHGSKHGFPLTLREGGRFLAPLGMTCYECEKGEIPRSARNDMGLRGDDGRMVGMAVGMVSQS